VFGDRVDKIIDKDMKNSVEVFKELTDNFN
jgi:hypothetical protein